MLPVASNYSHLPFYHFCNQIWFKLIGINLLLCCFHFSIIPKILFDNDNVPNWLKMATLSCCFKQYIKKLFFLYIAFQDLFRIINVPVFVVFRLILYGNVFNKEYVIVSINQFPCLWVFSFGNKDLILK